MTFTSVFKMTLAAGVSAMALSSGALASNPEEMEARLAALEAMVADLRNELEAERARNAARNSAMTTEVEEVNDRVIELETREQPAQVTAAASPPGNGFMAGNTNITYGGFIDIDAHLTDTSDGDLGTTSITRDFYIPGATPVGGTGDSEPDFDFTGQGSRFFFATTTPTDNGDIKSRLEFDFLGSPGGNERVSNSYNPRLRVAWAEMGNWRIGQDWSTFQNTAAIPESASFLALSDGMVFVRQPQIRYTNGDFQVSLENSETTVTPFGGGGRIVSGDGATPDVVARYNVKRDGVNVAFTGIARRLSAEVGGIDGHALGWGVSVQGRVSLMEGSDLRFSATAGEGVGRYIGLNAINGAVVDASGDLEAIPVYGGLVAWRQEFGENSRLNIGYSFLEADNDVALTGTGATRNVQSGYAALLTSVGGGVTIGGEVMIGSRELENGTSGSISRVTLSTKYAF